MHEFKLHLKSGQTLTWKCKGKKRAKRVKKDLKLVLPNQNNLTQEILRLGRKSKGENELRFLPGELIGYEVIAPAKNFIVSGITNGGTFSSGQINAIAQELTGGKLKAKNEEETD